MHQDSRLLQNRIIRQPAILIFSNIFFHYAIVITYLMD